tara:strand:- start:3776 stop:4393 length:618 start_codon:yes stop_codon:yes gene_type:complete
MANVVSSVKGFFNAANEKADRLSSIAKGALCIPSMISGMPDLGKQAVGQIVASASTILDQASSIVSSLVIGSIGGAVDKITGSITGFLNSVTGVVASIKGTVDQAEEFKEGIKDRVIDIKDFTASKENCNFAAATLLNCITSQALSNVTAKGATEIAKGLESVTSVSDKISDTISGPTGAIDRTIRKAAYDVGRAERMVSKANIF